MREAWISPYDNSVRVTLDRQVYADSEPSCRLTTSMDNPALLFKNLVILELKFTNRFPDWFGDLVRVFGVMQCGAAKYADGVVALGEGYLSRAFAFDVRPQLTNIPSSENERTVPAAPSAGGLDALAK